MPNDKTNAIAANSNGVSSRLNSSLPTVSTITPVIIGLAIATWYNRKQTFLKYFLTKFFLILPPTCLETSPPSNSCINHLFPALILLLLACMLVFTIKTFHYDEPPKEVLDIIAQEYDKRHDVLQGVLAELRVGYNKEDEDLDVFNAAVVWDSLRPLLELTDYNKKLAKDGFKWLWILVERDLEVTLKLTKMGEDVKFASGFQLEMCVLTFDSLIACPKDHDCGPSSDKRKQLYKLKREAKYYLRIHGLKTVLKAIKMAIHAKEAFSWLFLQTLCTTATAMLSPLSVHYRAQVLENLNDVQGLIFWEAAKAMVLVELLSTVLGLLTKMVKTHAETLANKEISIAYYDGLLKMPLAFWSRQSDMHRKESVTFRTVLNFDKKVTSFLEIPQKFLTDLIKSCTYAYLVLCTSSRSLLLLIGAKIGSIGMFWVLGKAKRRLATWSAHGVIQTSSSDMWTCMFSLRPAYISTYLSFVRGPKEIKRFAGIQKARAEKSKRRILVEVFNGPISSLVTQGSKIAQFSTARTNVLEHELGIAGADAMLKSAENFVKQAGAIGGIFGKVVEAAKPLAEAYDIISLPKSIDPDVGLWPEGKAKGVIEFRDVRFKYPRREGEVLKGVNLIVQHGDTVGMTGSAGCGKSTCMALLQRFYDVSSGSILLDGVDIREYNPRWLRGQISSVAQEPMLVPKLTIRENLTFGCVNEPSLEEIHDALRAAHIYDSIMDKDKFPQGLRTEIAEASNVSGGEKQRIAIARALLADPPILLLDEATSALDEESQEKVQEALDALMKGRTTLVIAHRLSTLKNSSKIVAFDMGTVVEEGTHEELLEKETGLYRKLWNKQTSMRVDAEDDDEEEVEEIKQLDVGDSMDPQSSGLRVLQNIIQDLSHSDPKKKDLLRVCKMLEQELQRRNIQESFTGWSAVGKWDQHTEAAEISHQ